MKIFVTARLLKHAKSLQQAELLHKQNGKSDYLFDVNKFPSKETDANDTEDDDK
jgi:hypothetical protein